MLNWASQFSICCFLDSHHYKIRPYSVDCMLAVGSLASIDCKAGSALTQLEQFQRDQQDWIFGHLAYDLKNEIESLESGRPDFIGFNDLSFFCPEVILILSESSLEIGMRTGHQAEVFYRIQQASEHRPVLQSTQLTLKSRLSKQQYLETIDHLRNHILRGDCYEINFCQEFYAENIQLDSLGTFLRLSGTSPTPFSAYYRQQHLHCMCASPERYLKKTGNELISQPIKGTITRDQSNEIADARNRLMLLNSEKDRAENVMVVDLVRNDLSKVCVEGSVGVDELYGIYSFANVHQMISTVRGTLRPPFSWIDAIRATFPMGSMTGAPKKRVMELIEQYEHTRRGLFSGAIGYVTPSGDFDFNVVIRSVFYNASTGYLSVQAGSGITYQSNSLDEYEECLLKIQGIKKVLE